MHAAVTQTSGVTSSGAAPENAARQGAGASDASPSSTSPTFDSLVSVPLQTSAAPSTASSAAPAAAGVTTDTLADLAGQTAAQVGSGASQFQITLTPEGLGQVSVTVNVGAEGRLSAAFAAEKPETAEALSGRSSDLQKALEQAGFSLSDSGLTFAVATPAGHGQGAGQDAAGGSGQGSGQGAGQGSGQSNSGQSNSGQSNSGQSNSGQSNSGQSNSGQGGGQGSNPALAQAFSQGAGDGAAGGQGRSWPYGQAGGRTFAAPADTAADLSSQSPYASRSMSGLDIRI